MDGDGRLHLPPPAGNKSISSWGPIWSDLETIHQTARQHSLWRQAKGELLLPRNSTEHFNAMKGLG